LIFSSSLVLRFIFFRVYFFLFVIRTGPFFAAKGLAKDQPVAWRAGEGSLQTHLLCGPPCHAESEKRRGVAQDAVRASGGERNVSRSPCSSSSQLQPAPAPAPAPSGPLGRYSTAVAGSLACGLVGVCVRHQERQRETNKKQPWTDLSFENPQVMARNQGELRSRFAAAARPKVVDQEEPLSSTLLPLRRFYGFDFIYINRLQNPLTTRVITDVRRVCDWALSACSSTSSVPSTSLHRHAILGRPER
jgi:hypothetical protein